MKQPDLNKVTYTFTLYEKSFDVLCINAIRTVFKVFLILNMKKVNSMKFSSGEGPPPMAKNSHCKANHNEQCSFPVKPPVEGK